ncbi:MAG: hypothetical protein K8T89_23210 [Planctomycetes bacterium]|nr:hypothetical protein [Planctomycetota bacterium]
MRRHLPMIALVFIAGCSSELKEYSPDGTFQILLPDTPKMDSSEHASGLKTKTYRVEERGGIYIFSVTDYPDGDKFIPAEIEGRFKAIRETLLEQHNAKLVSESETSMANGPGRALEATLTTREGRLRSRFYLIKGKLYQLTTIGVNSWSDSDSVRRFLDSLQIVNPTR